MITLTTIAPQATAPVEATGATANSSEAEVRSTSYSGSYRQAYNEMTDQHVVEVDVLEQLKANLSQLEDLHQRMRFMMGELSYLLKKN